MFFEKRSSVMPPPDKALPGREERMPVPAKHFVNGTHLEQGLLNRVEAVIRTFDPCLSCATHALGEMPLHIQLIAHDGRVVDELTRD